MQLVQIRKSILLILYNKMTCFIKIKFVTTRFFFTKNTIITTKLNWKLFTKAIRDKQRSLGLLRQQDQNREAL
jgi:hypothetical protein